MTKIAKPYDVTPEAIAARRAAGKGPEGDVTLEQAMAALTALAPLGVALLMISACLFFTFIW